MIIRYYFYMIPIVIENFLSEELLNKFFDYCDNDYNIDKISYSTGDHFIKCNKMKLEYNRKSKTEILINHIIKFVKLKNGDINDKIKKIDVNEIICVEYWNKHLINQKINIMKDKTIDNSLLEFHVDTDEQNLLVHNISELSIIYYFKKKYDNGLLLINKTKNDNSASYNELLFKCKDEILNDKSITERYFVIEPKFNKLVLFYGGEHYHGVSKTDTIRDSLVLNLWKLQPYTQKSLQYNENNIYTINKIMCDDDICNIKEFMDNTCENNVPLMLSNYTNNKIGKDIDEIILKRLINCLRYLYSEIKYVLPGNNDTGYILLKANKIYSNELLQYDNRYLYIEIALDDIEYEFNFHKKVSVKKNSLIVLPYSWNYNFKINSTDNYRYTIITNMK